MITGKSKRLIVSVVTLAAVLAFSFSASAKLAANKLAANLIAANSASESVKFDVGAVKVSKVTLPDGTVLTAE